MNAERAEQALVAGGVGYLIILAACIYSTSYDVWGALMVLPPIVILGVMGLQRLFTGSQRPLVRIMLIGLAAKLGGTLARYWISFDAYGGATDAQRYHSYAEVAAGRIWNGADSVFSAIPYGTGTAFMERLTTMVYTLTGTSKLAGFLTFAFMAFWGTAFFVKAACIAVPDLHQRRYALLCVLTPSLVYWPSSIGKEAPMLLCLGVAAYGFARMLTRRGTLAPMFIASAGLGGTMFIRPHIGGLFLAGFVPALIVMLLRGRGTRAQAARGRGAERVVLVVVIVIALGVLAMVGSATKRYLQFDESDSSGTVGGLTDILTETTRRTSEAGSNFRPPSVAGVTDWPKAVLRTLTRPLIIEARNMFQLVTALEMTAMIALIVGSYRRSLNALRLVLTNPFVTFALTTLFLGGLAYSSFANLGVLARQKSLILPLMALIPCLPVHRARRRQDKAPPPVPDRRLDDRLDDRHLSDASDRILGRTADYT